MTTDLILTMYFQGLYPTAEFNKIDLCSRNFYLDAADFYSKKASEKQRLQIISGIKYLFFGVKVIDEFEYIGKAWEQASILMILREAIFKGPINLYNAFRIEVSNILENRKNSIVSKNEKEIKRLKEEINENMLTISANKALIKELNTENPKAKEYIIKNDNEMLKIYSVFQEAFDCNYSTFRLAIETANFQLVNIKKQNITQFLTYRLSYVMGKDWYTSICTKMKWRKSVCSGQGSKLKYNTLIKKLDKIISIPQKE